MFPDSFNLKKTKYAHLLMPFRKTPFSPKTSESSSDSSAPPGGETPPLLFNRKTKDRFIDAKFIAITKSTTSYIARSST